MNGATLWAKRILLGLTTNQLADILGTSRKRIGIWEKKDGYVPAEAYAVVTDLLDRRAELIAEIWERHIAEDESTIMLLNRDEDIPDYAPDGTTVQSWNNAVVGVLAEAASTGDTPDLEWHRYLRPDVA